MKRQALFVSLAVCLTEQAPAAWTKEPDPYTPTCVGYIAAMEASARTGDPTASQAYINIADKQYLAANLNFYHVGLPPLPLSATEDEEARRAMVVVGACKQNMSLPYSNAVGIAYLKMRWDSGLPIEPIQPK